jgi:LysM repeat protein
MYRSAFFIAVFFLFFIQLPFAQTASENTGAEKYIEDFHEAAIVNMIAHKVPASITLAQGLFESGFGNSPLAKNANNHFGIKCHEWKGETYYHDDDAPQECFRKYTSAADSYQDHALFLKNRKRYAKCFELEITDYAGWARELKAAGYATLPTYAERIVSVIERFSLFRFDREALDRMNVSPEGNKSGSPSPGETMKQLTEENSEVSQENGDLKQPAASSSSAEGREIREVNGVPFIIAKAGDTKNSLCAEFNLAEWQIRRYNDLPYEAEIEAGSRVYLAPKKEFSTELDAHIVSEGESLARISNLHAVRKEAIMELNKLAEEIVQPGQTLRLR